MFPARRCKRESLKVLGTVGEPINPEAWQWYYSVVGEKRCPIVDTFWQTETASHQISTAPCWRDEEKALVTGCSLTFQGGHVLTPLPAATPLKPGSAVSK